MASAELSRRIEKLVGYPLLVDLDGRQRREFQAALLDADSFEDLPGKWQAAILEAEGKRPNFASSAPRRASQTTSETSPVGLVSTCHDPRAEAAGGWLKRWRGERRERRERDEYYRQGRSPEPSMLERAGYHRRTGRWEWLTGNGCGVVALLTVLLGVLLVAARPWRSRRTAD